MLKFKLIIAFFVTFFTVLGVLSCNPLSTTAATGKGTSFLSNYGPDAFKADILATNVENTVQKRLTFVLIHGAWSDASFWDKTAAELRKAGHIVYTPEYAGHGEQYDPHVTHEQITKSVLDFIKVENLDNFILVGFSFGGTVIQKVSEQIPDRIKRLVFFDAFVLPDGQSVGDQLPPELQRLFKQWAEASRNNTILIPFPIFRDTFVNTASLETAQEIYKNLKPEPVGPLFEKLDLKKFYTLKIPKSYLYLTSDTGLPQGPYGWHPTQSSRLGFFRLIRGVGDHMSTALTQPKMLAEKIMEAGRD